MAFDTPGSKIDRALSAEFLLNKVDSKVQLGLQSPWSKYAFTGMPPKYQTILQYIVIPVIVIVVCYCEFSILSESFF
jgi:hypothetical protein